MGIASSHATRNMRPCALNCRCEDCLLVTACCDGVAGEPKCILCIRMLARLPSSAPQYAVCHFALSSPMITIRRCNHSCEFYWSMPWPGRPSGAESQISTTRFKVSLLYMLSNPLTDPDLLLSVRHACLHTARCVMQHLWYHTG